MPNVQLPDGRKVTATKLDFETITEPWSEYELEDGTTLKAKVVATGVARIDPEDHGQGDEPLYNLNSETVVRTSEVPEELLADGGDASHVDDVERGVE